MARARFDKFRQEIVENSVYTMPQSSRLAFIKKVYTYFAASLGVAFIGSLIGMNSDFVFMNSGLLFFTQLILIVALYFLKKKEPVNQILFFSFTFVSGLNLGPLLFSYGITGNMGVVVQALALTTIAFGGLTAYAWTTKKDFSYMTGFLWIGFFLLIGGMILNFFFQSPFMNTLISMFGILLFSMFILYDTQNIMKRYPEDEYIMGAVDLYLDFINLFLFILSLLSNDR